MVPSSEVMSESSRKKHDYRFPERAIDYCLEEGGRVGDVGLQDPVEFEEGLVVQGDEIEFLRPGSTASLHLVRAMQVSCVTDLGGERCALL